MNPPLFQAKSDLDVEAGISLRFTRLASATVEAENDVLFATPVPTSPFARTGSA